MRAWMSIGVNACPRLVAPLAPAFLSVRSYARSAVRSSDASEDVLPFRQASFNSVFLDLDMIAEYVDNTSEFSVKLYNTITKCRKDGKYAIWLQVPMVYAHYISVAGLFGFRYHHALDQTAHLLLWLPESPCTVPPFATHHLGVAGCVRNDKGEVLVVQEKSKNGQWKLPGGYAEPKEDIHETAVREVFEETGIRTSFEGVLAFRHQHAVLFGQSDIYAICLLKPLNEEIKKCPREISEARWMPLADLKAGTRHPMMRTVASLLESKDTQLLLQHTQPSQVPGRGAYKLYHPPTPA